jgi:large subunit ribosomal protein L4
VSSLVKYNSKGKKSGDVEFPASLSGKVANPQMIKDYIVALRANQRQWSASTQGRSEVSHSNKKPHRQKGTGNARQGTLAAPQYKGGGVVFGPKPKFNQHVRINKKERRAVIAHLLGKRLEAGDVILVEDAMMTEAFDKPSTKAVAGFLKAVKVDSRRVLFVAKAAEETEAQSHFKKSVRNFERSAFELAPNLNGYDLMAARKIVMTESALQQLTEQLG